MLYNKAECDKCKPLSGKEKKLPKSIDEIIEKFGSLYKKTPTQQLPNEFVVGLRYFAKIATGENTLSSVERSIWNGLTNIQKNGFTDWKGLNDKVTSMRKLSTKKKLHGVNAKADATVFELARAIKKEQEEDEKTPKMDTPDYDSTYVAPS